MLEKLGRIRLLYIVLGVLLLVGLAPMAFTGILLSGRSADELRSVEGRYQAQLVQDKARQIELYGQRYRDVVTGLARAFEISGGIRALDDHLRQVAFAIMRAMKGLKETAAPDSTPAALKGQQRVGG